MKKWLVRVVIGAALALGVGCAHCRESPEFESQTISTRGTVRLDVDLSDNTTVKMLVGAADAQPPSSQPPGKPQQQSAMMSMLAAAPATVVFTDSEDVGGSPAPLISTGFIYIVRPPAWPMVRTPGTRGGTPMSDAWDGVAYVGAWVDGGVQRIFFLGAFDQHGNARPTTRLVVEDDPVHPSNPADVTLAIGEYAEAQMVGSNLQIIRGAHPVTSTLTPDHIRNLLIQMRQQAEENGLPWNPDMNIPPGGSS